MDLAEDVFTANWYDKPECRSQVRIDGKHTIATAVCAGIGQSRADSDRGAFNEADATVAFKTADAPAGTIRMGSRIEIRVGTDPTWQAFRIATKGTTGAITTLTLENLNE